MNINLHTLTQAVAAMQMLREQADQNMSTEQFIQALRAWSALKSEVEQLTKHISVEVEA